MIEALKETILDQQQLQDEAGVKRRLAWELVPRKAFICMGVRRCGKSTLLRQIRQHLIQKKQVDPKSFFHFDFFDDRFQALRQTGFPPPCWKLHCL